MVQSLRARLNLLIVILTVVIIAITAVSTAAFLKLTDARHHLLNEVDPASLSAGQLLLSYVDEETGIRGYILGRNFAYLQPAVSGFAAQKKASKQLNAALAHQPALLRSAKQAEHLGQVWQTSWALPAFKATAANNATYATPQELAQGKTLLDHVRTAFTTLDDQLTASRQQYGDNLNTATVRLVIVLLVGLVLLVGGAIAVSVALRRWVTQPLGSVTEDARQVTTGDLAHPIGLTGPLEIRVLASDIEAMRVRIVQELGEVDSARAETTERNIALDRSNHELEQFAYVASHDLQEPLRKVTSFVQLLQQRYEGQLDARADEYIGFAVDGASRMQQLISDLLAFSRVGRNADRFHLTPLAESITAALDNLDIPLRETSAAVSVAPDLPQIVGDPILLTSLWQNLIGNSLKFRSEAAPQIDIAVRPEGGFWLLSVSDNGIGIEPRFADKVFVIFQRLHGRDAYAGTGIGLALCKKIVEFHGGEIWLDSEVSSGTRICLTLPVERREIRT
jgi:signal transduction histidine kinase